MNTLEGHFLVATPQLADPNFAKSLVLLVQHGKDGAFGLVVNRPLTKTVQELWREVGSAPCHSCNPIYLGGPVPGPLMALHDRPEFAEAEPAPGVYFAARKSFLDALVLDERPSYKIFVGHAGWGAGQLENEIREGAWQTAPASGDHVFATDDAVWERVFRQLGDNVLKSILHLKELPPDPTVN